MVILGLALGLTLGFALRLALGLAHPVANESSVAMLSFRGAESRRPCRGSVVVFSCFNDLGEGAENDNGRDKEKRHLVNLSSSWVTIGQVKEKVIY